MDTAHYIFDPGSTAPEAIHSVAEFYAIAAKSPVLRAGGTITLEAAAGCEEDAEACRELLSFLTVYQKNKQRLSSKMDSYNEKIVKQYANLPYVSKLMQEYVRMNQAGKFIRGALVNIGYSLFAGENAEPSDALALAFEILQTAVLIHDDIIDHAKLRRGQTTIHEQYAADWAETGLPVSPVSTDTARSMAMCAGDIGIYLSALELAETYGEKPQFGRVMVYFNQVMLNTLFGEVIDVALPFSELNHRRENVNIRDDIMEIYRLKTAWYTLTGPLCLGGMLAGANQAQLGSLERFAEQLGIAFQIKDDILGIFGDAETGKDVGSDISEYKQTLLYAYVKEQGTELENLRKYYGKETLEPGDLEDVQEIFRRSGALDYAENTMNECFDAARRQLRDITFLTEEQKLPLRGLERFIRLRRS